MVGRRQKKNSVKPGTGPRRSAETVFNGLYRVFKGRTGFFADRQEGRASAPRGRRRLATRCLSTVPFDVDTVDTVDLLRLRRLGVSTPAASFPVPAHLFARICVRFAHFRSLCYRIQSFSLFFCVLPSFTGFYLVLLSFTGFYLVLQGFYLVLMDFTGFY